MRSYLISDNVDTFVGMKMAGIECIVLHEKEEIINWISNKLKSQSLHGIFLLRKKTNYSKLGEKYKKWDSLSFYGEYSFKSSEKVSNFFAQVKV